MRFLLALIGYLAIATLIAQGTLLGYLWSSDRLNDEKVFRIVALVHDIKLDKPAVESETTPETETPPEEPSTAEVERVRKIAMRNFEVKMNALDSGKSEYNHMLRQLSTASSRFDRLATEFQHRIEQESASLEEQNIASVVDNLKSMKADRAKALLLLTLEQGAGGGEAKLAAMDEVIRLLKAMPAGTREAILKKFADPAEMQKLHEVHQRMLAGGEKQEVLDDIKRQIEERDYGP